MRNQPASWSIRTLRARIRRINFPEYQREPTVWSRDAKQRLIDSITRRFDIASFYFYLNPDDSWDCVDGRQRIGAIMSFLDENPQDEHAGFEFKVLNEIFEDVAEYTYRSLAGETYRSIEELADGGHATAEAFRNAFLDYPLNVVTLQESSAPEEFNLQFARLNLGTIINSGEKLNAMVGALRDRCFDDLGTHPFLGSISIPTRRFAREQLAAQITAQVFAVDEGTNTGLVEFARTRHMDLQRLFKDHAFLDRDKEDGIERLQRLLDLLAGQMQSFPVLRSRAIVLSAVLLAYQEGIQTDEEARMFADFVSDFVHRLNSQIRKEPHPDHEYDYLLEFQRHLTQASVEKAAVAARAATLARAFAHWKEHDCELPGDAAYLENHPGEDLVRRRR